MSSLEPWEYFGMQEPTVNRLEVKIPVFSNDPITYVLYSNMITVPYSNMITAPDLCKDSMHIRYLNETLELNKPNGVGA